jgi:hypothetical protein
MGCCIKIGQDCRIYRIGCCGLTWGNLDWLAGFTGIWDSRKVAKEIKKEFVRITGNRKQETGNGKWEIWTG